MSKKILVTGAAGFLGSHLCRRLLSEGHNVFGIDNLLTGRRENVRDIRDHGRFNFAYRDIRGNETGFYDEIYNLACPAAPDDYQRLWQETMDACTTGVVKLLDLASDTGAKFLQASTSEIYGDPIPLIQCEKYRGNVSTTGPRACYDEGKRIAETYCAEYERHGQARTRIARIFNSYGPGLRPDDGRIINSFIMAALQNKDIIVHGNGEQTRSFCYVDDTIAGLILLMESEDNPGPVNIGNDQTVTVNEMAAIIKSLTGSKSRVIHRQAREDDPTMRTPDISRAYDKLEWRPLVSMEEGLLKTIAYYNVILQKKKG